MAKRIIAVGKYVHGKWQVRTSLWRYLTETMLSLGRIPKELWGQKEKKKE